MTEQPTTEQPPADAEIIREAHQRWGASSAREHDGQTLWEAIAAALAAAGRLLAEDAASAPVVNWGVDLGRGVIDYQARERPARLTATTGGGQVMRRYVTEWAPVSINEESTDR